jgi:hypothetical protein
MVRHHLTRVLSVIRAVVPLTILSLCFARSPLGSLSLILSEAAMNLGFS